jgi:hypothetical protein
VSVAAVVGLGGGLVAAKVRDGGAPDTAATSTGGPLTGTPSTRAASTDVPSTGHPSGGSPTSAPSDPSPASTSAPTTSQPGTTTSDTPPRSTSTPPTSTGGLLYFADGVIHDGSQQVAYHPQFQADVARVSRTGSGWIVFERFGQDGSRLVLAAHDGTTIPIDLASPHGYDVSPAGDAIAVPTGDSGHISLVNPADGSELGSVTTRLHWVRQVNFAGEDSLIVDGGGRSDLLRYDFPNDRVSPLRLHVPGHDVTVEDVSAGGTYLLAGYASGNRSCAAAFNLDGSAQPLWTTCRFSPNGSTSISPDGRRVALVRGSNAGESAPDFTVFDLSEGSIVGSVTVGFPLGVAWVDSAHLLIESATDSSYSTYTLQNCAVASVSCSDVLGSGAAPAADVAAGTTY